jgi:TcpE family
MELPTYTNIWKIEKRLYKLYDFRLPMPLPVGQVAAFLAIAAPYTLILTMVGMPFSHTWLWLYVLPPGALAWLVTRPVLEGKRLPELVLSQLRYLSEPRVWCRMAPLAEPDQIIVLARVWRSAALVVAASTVAEKVLATPIPVEPVRTVAEAAEALVLEPEGVEPEAVAVESAAPESAAPEPAVPVAAERVMVRSTAETGRPVWPTRPSIGPSAVRARQPAPPAEPVLDAMPADRPARRPGVTVRTEAIASRQPPLVERALRTAPDRRNGGWGDHVVLTPGGHRPGRPDLLQRDRNRARLPLPGPARIVVLGCTAGAGQTVTTLLTGQLLASIRAEAVAVIDLSPGRGSLTEQARLIPRLLPSRRNAAETQRGTSDGSRRERGLQVVTAGRPAGASETGAVDDGGTVIDAVVARYPLTLADPAAAQVPRSLHSADQLLLVAPASADGPEALAMTQEWLQAHGHGELARSAVIALNGVSDQTSAHTDKMAAVAAGQCRAIVRLPWDAGLAAGQAIGVGAIHAYTALAGVLVAGLAEGPQPPLAAMPAGPQPAGTTDEGGVR